MERNQMEQAIQQQQMARQNPMEQMPMSGQAPQKDMAVITQIEKKHPDLKKITAEQFAIFVENGENPEDLGLSEEEYQAYSEAGGFDELYGEVGM